VLPLRPPVLSFSGKNALILYNCFSGLDILPCLEVTIPTRSVEKGGKI
jgi:hypothetical protein